MSATKTSKPVVIKKYANRRLYNTQTSCYITLDDLSEMVRDGIEFEVSDAKTGENLTRSVLTQIIFERETNGNNLLPISFLRQLIQLYDDSLQWMVPRYLENAMQYFTQNQEKVRTYVMGALGDFSPLNQMEKVAERNAELFEQAMRLFPFPAAAPLSDKKRSDSKTDKARIATIKEQLEKLQKDLDAIKNS